MHRYDHNEVEKRWQEIWEKDKLYLTIDNGRGKNFYGLVEFAYPSGNLHVGHWYAFSVTDMYMRYMRMLGHNVMFPFGFDSFGLPAENAAIKRNLNPRDWTYQNIEYMKGQLRTMGTMFDWSREVVTSDPSYYKWTQWLFLEIFKKGLAYQSEVSVNWCPSCKTVLANEQVNAGHCERCDSSVEQRKMNQWQLKIRDYADRLIDDLDDLNWPEPIKEAQRNWIGRKDGINIKYSVIDSDEIITVFTTRPDTNFGATFIVLSPEHPSVSLVTKAENKEQVDAYILQSQGKTELERIQEGREKSGVFTGSYARNQLNGKNMPIWVGDFVLSTVGTGAVVGVPGHDLRDFEFAQTFDLPIVRVVVGPDGDISPVTRTEQVQEKEGVMVNSGFLDYLDIHEATVKVMDHMVREGYGSKVRNYRLRDWLVSRQRYWGCPIPIIHCEKCGAVPVAENDLPVELPDVEDYLPSGDGKSPLAKEDSFVNVDCPKCGGNAKRETDTLDTFVDSSWYFLRYTDPQNETEFASKKKMKNWMPVDFYSGGAEHTTMHLLYSRFFQKALYDLKLVKENEPYVRRMNRGIILGPDGQKMSKSKGNVVDPDEVVEQLGADTVRMYLGFIGPYNEVGHYPWSTESIRGVHRFLERVWRLQSRFKSQKSKEVEIFLHKTIKKVGEGFESIKINTTVSALMSFINEAERYGITKNQYSVLVVLLAPLAPHMAEELWRTILGNNSSVHLELWPEYDKKLLSEENITIAVQVNGKTRGELRIAPNTTQVDIEASAIKLENVLKWIVGKKISNVIYIQGRLVNIVLDR